METLGLASRCRTWCTVGELPHPAAGIAVVRVATTAHGVWRIDLLPRPSDLEAWVAGLQSELELSRGGIRRGGPAVEGVLEELAAYFRGRRRRFGAPLDLAGRGTRFERLVWEALREIPFGETRTYGEVAALLGRPQAARAVGQANGRNPIPIVIPCHRVVSSGGGLGGFSGGLGLKRALLRIEGHAV